jgi:hypothetical protein
MLRLTKNCYDENILATLAATAVIMAISVDNVIDIVTKYLYEL